LAGVLSKLLSDAGVRAGHLQVLSLSSVGLCIGLWIRAKTVDQDERGTPSAGRCSWACGRR